MHPMISHQHALEHRRRLHADAAQARLAASARQAARAGRSHPPSPRSLTLRRIARRPLVLRVRRRIGFRLMEAGLRLAARSPQVDVEKAAVERSPALRE